MSIRFVPFCAAFLTLAGCPSKQPATEAAVEATPQPRAMPESLPTPDFKAPATEVRTLSNGLKVVVASNHEVPLWDVRITFNTGGYLDPKAKTGLAEITFSMMNEGAAYRSSEDISRDLKALASSVYASAGADGASVSASGIKRNLEATLDIWADVVRLPTFPQKEWEIKRPQWLAQLKNARKAPSSIANRVYNHLIYGDTYRGRIPMEADYNGISPKDMGAFHKRWVGPSNAIIIAGGDITADELVPMLEARLGSWNPKGVKTPTQDISASMSDTSVMYFVDSPGAAQSILRPITLIDSRTAEDYFDMKMAMDILGGTFMSRVNMNLREDKGYSYGARCFDAHRFGPSIGMCNTSVQTAVTGPALSELKKELAEFVSTRPANGDELSYMKSSLVNKYPAKFETTSAMLNEQVMIWRYGLPEDWSETYLPKIESTELEGVNQAFKNQWSLDKTIWLVVGDKETIWGDLEGFGLEIIEIDVDGHRVGSTE